MYTRTTCFGEDLIATFSYRGLAIEEETFVPAYEKSELRVTIFLSLFFLRRVRRSIIRSDIKKVRKNDPARIYIVQILV